MLSKRSLAAAFFVAAAQRQHCSAQILSSTQDAVVSLITGDNTNDYEVSVESISITDRATEVTDIAAIHVGRPFDVVAALHWEDQHYDMDSTNMLRWETYVNDVLEDTGEVNLLDVR